ncbi:queuine tRNA-ribosyltransferase [archaeon BMS3Abin16]|nr:queuine tRNA-ribosyltransferase [archaeon BMS3Abin16]
MHLEILRHDGPARLGRLHFNDLAYPTPSLLWNTAAGDAPKGYLKISPFTGAGADDETLIEYGTIFSEPNIDEFGILPSFPTGFNTPLEIAREAVAETLRVADIHPGFGAVLEGGKYLELRREGAEYLRDRPIVEVAQADRLVRNHRKLVEVLTDARETLSPNTALYMPGVPPHLFAVLAYIGVDLFDLRSAVLGAHEGRYLTLRGVFNQSELTELPCPCGMCISSDAADLDFKALLSHNLWVSIATVREIRVALRMGGLRNLVEERVQSDINAMGALRILDRVKADFLEQHTQISPIFTRINSGGR